MLTLSTTQVQRKIFLSLTAMESSSSLFNVCFLEPMKELVELVCTYRVLEVARTPSRTIDRVNMHLSHGCNATDNRTLALLYLSVN